MRLGLTTVFLLLIPAPWAFGQTDSSGDPAHPEKTTLSVGQADYLVIGATADLECLLRSQVQVMNPEVLPLRIIFVPHWKYIDDSRTFHLRVPRGMSSVMFTHLPSRTVFIDNDRYRGGEWLGYYMAHELGHLVTNSVDEHQAERAARAFRRRLKTVTRNGSTLGAR